MRTIVVSGASGFVGSALAEFLRGLGCRVRPLVRGGRQVEGGIAWDPARGTIDAEELEGVSAIVHLAGENIAGRWTTAKKARVRESRVRGTALLAATIAELTSKPKVWVSCSGVNYYGDRGQDEVDESGPQGQDFLARVAADWEAAAHPARRAGVRVVHSRLGLVLAPHGGALAKMLLPFKLGLGGKLGSGEQVISWIALIDAVRALVHALDCEELEGAINVTAPAAVTNAEFSRALARALERPSRMAVPASLVRLLVGELADVALLTGVRAVPSRLLATQFRFEQPELARYFAQAFA